MRMIQITMRIWREKRKDKRRRKRMPKR